jgi:hypothetical protein
MIFKFYDFSPISVQLSAVLFSPFTYNFPSCCSDYCERIRGGRVERRQKNTKKVKSYTSPLLEDNQESILSYSRLSFMGSYGLNVPSQIPVLQT